MEIAKTLGARIKQARLMAGLNTQAALLARIPEWKPSRLGNYEAGISQPGPDDVMRIARATDVSPCWLMFGHGPIRPNARDLQAIRHQNLVHVVEEREGRRGAVARLARALGMKRPDLLKHVENPFLPIEDDLARRFEKAIKVTEGWMDEQHIEHDPLCASFPEDLRELMMLYSSQPVEKRRKLLEVMRVLAE
ncbi:helix-turn-helix domain-containing protein [Thiolapillus sp.]